MDAKEPVDPKRVLQILEFKRRTLSFVESMLAEDISIEQLSLGETIICQRDFDDIVQERFLLKLCGYPLCPNRVEKEWNQKYLVSLKNKKVYEVDERKLYCSLRCMNTAKKYRNDKLPEQPIWMRLDEIKIDPKIEVKLPEHTKSAWFW